MGKKIVNFDYKTIGLDTVTKSNLVINDLMDKITRLLFIYK